MIANYIKTCQICKSKDIKKFYSFGNLPPVNDYNKYENQAKTIYFNSDLLICKKCSLIQLGTIVDKEILFPKSYPYTSSTTKILRENFKELSEQVKKKKILNDETDLVLDIGSNDGNLLSNFKKYRVLGVTPEEIGKLAIKKGIPTLLRYFDKITAKLIKKKFGRCKLITATNVFAHIDKPNDVLENISTLLDKDGVFINESHYLIDLIKDNQYDTVYHEHLRYYSLTSLIYFFKIHGFHIFDCQKIKTHGGSIRVFASKNKKYKISKNISKILNKEKKVLGASSLEKFKKNILISKLKLHEILLKIKLKDQRVCGISAPSRSSTLINYVGLDEYLIDCIFEISGSYKIGNFMPGTKIKIEDEKYLAKYKPDYLIIFSWHIKDELKKIFRKKGFKGRFIIPLPKPRIE